MCWQCAVFCSSIRTKEREKEKNNKSKESHKNCSEWTRIVNEWKPKVHSTTSQTTPVKSQLNKILWNSNLVLVSLFHECYRTSNDWDIRQDKMRYSGHPIRTKYVAELCTHNLQVDYAKCTINVCKNVKSRTCRHNSCASSLSAHSLKTRFLPQSLIMIIIIVI